MRMQKLPCRERSQHIGALAIDDVTRDQINEGYALVVLIRATLLDAIGK